MRKWTYLVATLLMAGTTATFTGCIDTDEPEGIAELRGAKSELIKAQAAVKLVEVEWQKAQVAYQELENKAKELSNQYQEYDNQMHALDVELKKLEVERAEAATEREKAEAEAKIAEANRNKAFWENKMAEEAEIFKASILKYQTSTAQAQEAYDNAIKLIEAGKLLLSDGEKAIINKAQVHLANAATAMNGKYLLLMQAQNAYNAAITDPTTPTLAGLQALLKQAEVAVEKNEILLKEKENLLALAEDFDAAEWDAEYQKLQKKVSEYQSLQDKAEVENAKIKVSEAYKAAEKNVSEKKELKKTAKKAYDHDGTPNGAKQDSIAATKAERTIKAYKSEPIDDGLKELFANDFNSKGYDKATGVFSYKEGTYTQAEYDEDLTIADESARTTVASIRINRVNGWIDALTAYTVDENGVAWNEQMKAGLVKKATEAGKTSETAYGYWDIARKAYTAGTKATPTEPIAALEKIEKAYNEAYKGLDDAIKAYNKAYDDKYKSAYDKEIAALKTTKTLELYEKKVGDNDTYKKYLADNPKVDATQKIAYIKTYILAKADYEEQDKAVEEYLKGEGKTAAETVAGKAWNGSEEQTAANKTLTTANAAVKKAIQNIAPAISAFKSSDYATGKLSIATPYGQVVVNDDYNTKKITGSDGTAKLFYEDEKDGKGVVTGHIVATVSDIDATEFAKLTETKVDNAIARTAVTSTSDVAFGKTIKTTGSTTNDRLEPVTEKMIRNYVAANAGTEINEANFGKLGAKIEADDAVTKCTAKINAVKTIKNEITLFEGVLTSLKAEIQANTDLMKPFIAAADKARAAVAAAEAEVKKAEEARDALNAEAVADVLKYSELVADYTTLSQEVQTQIDGIKTGDDMKDLKTVEAILNYWKKAVADQEVVVESGKQNLTAAEKNIELFNKGEYSQAYVVEQKRIAMEAAAAIYDAAKVVYDDALAQVKSVLETLVK